MQSQCWDVLGMLGYNVFCFGWTKCNPNVGICWDVLGMLGYPASPPIGARCFPMLFFGDALGMFGIPRPVKIELGYTDVWICWGLLGVLGCYASLS